MKLCNESERKVLGIQSCPTLGDSVDCSLPGSSVHGIFQARILEWVAISFSRCFPDPGIEAKSPALAGGFFTTDPPGKSLKNLNIHKAVNAEGVREIGSIPGSEDPLVQQLATHSSVLAWEIPWTEEPGRLQSIGLQRVGHD